MPESTPETALRVAQLALDPKSWIRRRVEQVAYLDESMIRRRISIDFVVPTFPADPPEHVSLNLPLALFAKRKLTRFDLRTASGESLAMYTAAENAAISRSVLHALANHHGLGYVDPVLDRSVDTLVTASTDVDRASALGRIFDARTTIGRHLALQRDFVTLARELADGFILYVPMPRTDIGLRRIVKLSFDSPKRAPRAVGIRERLGWRAVDDRFSIPLAGYTQSYHFEIDAPPEMEVTKGAFYAFRNGEVAHDETEVPVPCAHFNLANLDRLPGQAFVSLRARSKELLGGVLLLAIVNVAAQAMVLWRIHTIEQHNGAEAVVAALLALPAVLLSYLVRPGEHRVLTGFLTDVRRAALTCGLTSFGAAIVVFGGFSEAWTRRVLVALLAIAGICALLLSGSRLAQSGA